MGDQDGVPDLMVKFDRSAVLLKEELWMDDWHVVGLPKGLKVFDKETEAVALMRLNELWVHEEIRVIFENSAAHLAEADARLAGKAIEEAKQLKVSDWVKAKLLELQLKIAERKYEEGSEKASEGKYLLALSFFKEAWEHAQLAIQLAQA